MTRELELDCRRLVELVTDYLEGALSEADRRRFDAHVAGCDGCAAYVDQMRATLRALGHLREADLRPEQRSALLAAFRDWRSSGGPGPEPDRVPDRTGGEA